MAGVTVRGPRGYFFLGDFPDHDPGAGVLDYNCGTRTHNRADHVHGGTDFYLEPDRWRMMDEGRVEVIAGAAGTIVEKVDGNFDRKCAGFSGEGQQGNVVYLQHDDGSFSWYVHLKTGSLTSKA